MRRLLPVLSVMAFAVALLVAPASAQAPTPPQASTRDATDVTSYTATLVGVVAPGGRATRARFEYGVTPDRLVGATDFQDAGTEGTRTVTAALGGLTPGVRVYFRVAAVSDAGTGRGGVRSFVPPRDLQGVTLAVRPDPAVFGGAATAAGRLRGRGLAGTQVELQAQSGTAWRKLGPTVQAAADGRFAFPLDGLVVPLRLRAVPVQSPELRSPARRLRLRPRVNLVVRLAGRGRRAFTGTVRPATAGTRVSLQRRLSRGRWVTVARRGTASASRVRTQRFAFRIRARKGAYRVVSSLAGPGWALGISRERALAGTTRSR